MLAKLLSSESKCKFTPKEVAPFGEKLHLLFTLCFHFKTRLFSVFSKQLSTGKK